MSGIPQQAPFAGVSFEELLHAHDVEMNRWHQWFLQQPAVLLNTPTSIAKAGDLRTLLLHVVAVQLRYAEWLHDIHATTDVMTLPHESADQLFAIGQQASGMIHTWVQNAGPEELSKVIEYRRGDFVLRATKRKAFLQVIFHTSHHFAQIAVLVREAGHPTDWIHDFIFSPAMT